MILNNKVNNKQIVLTPNKSWDLRPNETGYVVSKYINIYDCSYARLNNVLPTLVQLGVNIDISAGILEEAFLTELIKLDAYKDYEVSVDDLNWKEFEPNRPIRIVITKELKEKCESVANTPSAEDYMLAQFIVYALKGIVDEAKFTETYHQILYLEEFIDVIIDGQLVPKEMIIALLDSYKGRGLVIEYKPE